MSNQTKCRGFPKCTGGQVLSVLGVLQALNIGGHRTQSQGRETGECVEVFPNERKSAEF